MPFLPGLLDKCWLLFLWKVKVKLLSRVRLFATPWMVAYQAPQSMGFSRQDYWSGLPFPCPGDLPNPEIELGSPALQTDALSSEPLGKPLAYGRIAITKVILGIANKTINNCAPHSSGKA